MWVFTLFLKCVKYKIPVWTGHSPVVTRMHKRTTIHHTQHMLCTDTQKKMTGVNMEAIDN